jgi:hypothetical protein
MSRFFLIFLLSILLSSINSSIVFADYNLKCSSTNFNRDNNTISHNNIYADITEAKDKVNFNFLTSLDETFTLIANHSNKRIVLDKLEGIIFLEEIIKGEFKTVQIFYCQGLVQEKI